MIWRRYAIKDANTGKAWPQGYQHKPKKGYQGAVFELFGLGRARCEKLHHGGLSTVPVPDGVSQYRITVHGVAARAFRRKGNARLLTVLCGHTGNQPLTIHRNVEIWAEGGTWGVPRERGTL